MSAGIQQENIETLKRTVEVYNTSTVSSFGPSTDLLQKAIALSNGYERKTINRVNDNLIALTFYSKSLTNSDIVVKSRFKTAGLPIKEVKENDAASIKIWLLQTLKIDELYNFLLSKNVVDSLFESLINNIIKKVTTGIYIDNDKSLLRQALSSLGRTYISKRF